MKQIIPFILFMIICVGTSFSANRDLPTVSKGKIIRLSNFESRFVESRNIDVWLPENYNPRKRYSVVYMHDGQMLFDSTKTWNRQEWGVDETVSRLIESKKIKDCIIVGVWNIPQLRYAEYFPQRVIDSLDKPQRDLILSKQFKTEPKADDYLMFLVYELKPYIDSHFSTYKNQSHTFIMGSSMGGLISLYALCEYPTIFGGAACLSMHSIMVSYELIDEKLIDNVTSVFRSYLKSKLPKANRHKIYIDYGDKTLDAYYKPYQLKIDQVIRQRGFKPQFWQTREFLGEDHSENAWKRRLNIPLEFLL